MPLTIYDQIEDLWRRENDAIGRKAPVREHKEFSNQISAENRIISQIELQPWLAIFEFGLEWLTNLYLALRDEERVIPQNSELHVPWALIGSACAFAASVRNLCLNGFDTPARALLRTYSDTLFLCLAMLDDKELSLDYRRLDEDSKIKDFWHTKASPRNLHKRIKEIEKKFGLSDPYIIELTEWRSGEYSIFSQANHLSFIAALHTVFPPVFEKDMRREGILGVATPCSLRTMMYASWLTAYFALFSSFFMFEEEPGVRTLLLLDKENELYKDIFIGRNVLSELVARNWDIDDEG